MRLKSARQTRKTIIRRAVFVCNHPDLGLVFINRSVFQRRWRPNLDECKMKSSVIDRARGALRSVFLNDAVEMSRLVMVPTRQGVNISIEQTVFMIDSIFESVLRRFPKETFVLADDHQLGVEVRRTLCAGTSQEKVRRLG